jgi:serine/threonine-protein kinase RsbW
MPGQSTHIQLKNCCSESGKLWEFLEAFAKDIGLPRKEIKQINLAVEELFDNIVSYAFPDAAEHRIDIFVSIRGDTITVRIEDDGRPFNPLEVKAPDLSCTIEKCPVGGLGIFLARKLMDGFSYRRKETKNIVVMKKQIPRNR